MDLYPDGYGSEDDDSLAGWYLNALDNYGGGEYYGHLDMDDFFFNSDQYSNYDDDDFYESFSDAEYSDAEDHNKIFISLQDSNVLRRLNFHKALGNGRYRLPRVKSNHPETYESVYKVLEELEIMLKVWRKRTDHAFTAHIERNGSVTDGAANNEKDGDDNCSMRLGVDYSEKDIAHEFDGEESDIVVGSSCGGLSTELGPGARPPAKSNDALTKRKYCQSTKLFYDIFETDRHFDAFYALVHKAKKHIYAIIFPLFLNSFPEEVVSRLPRELWEKIWKHTQLPYDECNSFKVGNVSTDRQGIELENDRLLDLFGSSGNFHMLIFEALFKHPYITQTPPLLEMESLEVKDSQSKRLTSYVKTRFQRYSRLFEMHFNRLVDLAAAVAPEQGEDDAPEPVDHVRTINQGLFTCKRHRLPTIRADTGGRLRNNQNWLPNEMLIKPSVSCDVVALLDGDVLPDNQSYLNVIIWNAKRSAPVAFIKTGVSILDAICGKNRNDPCHLFALSQNRFAFLLRNAHDEKDTFTVYQWTFDAGWSTPKNLDDSHCDKSITGEVECSAGDSERVTTTVEPFRDISFMSLKLTELGEERVTTFVVGHQNPNGGCSSLLFFDACAGGSAGKTIEFKKSNLVLECLKSNRAVLRDVDKKAFLFVNLETGLVVATYEFRELCKDAGHDHTNGGPYMLECVYEVKMDQNPDCYQFIIFSQNLTSFQLFEYDDGAKPSETQFPEVIHSGSTLVYEMSWRTLGKVCLYNGVLYAVPSADINLRAHTGDYYLDNINSYSVDLFAFDLSDCSIHPIVNMIETDEHREGYPVHKECVLMNEYSRRIYADQLRKRSPFFVNDTTMVVDMRQAYVEVAFHRNAKAFNDRDRALLHEMFKLREEERKSKEEKKAEEFLRKEKRRKDEDALRRQYIDSGVLMYGKVKRWHYSYGFLKITLPKKAKKAGNVFVHISDIKNRGKRFIKTGQKVSFMIASDKGGKSKAVDVKLLAAREVAEAEAAAGFGPGPMVANAE